MIAKPLPHTEARERIAGLPRVSREVMDGMLPELKAYAFTITGLDVGDQMAKVQDTLAAVPAGEKTWEESKKEIAAELADALGGKQAERRAELLLRTHVFRGYAAARYRTLMEQADVFPFWQYKTHGDGNVRPSHMALNGKIFPAGHDIWQRIFPPWDWGCRCLVVPLTAGAVKRMQDAGMPAPKDDGTLLPTQRARPEVFTPRETDLISKAQRLPDGASLTPSQTWSGAPWSIPGNIRHDWPLIEARYKDQPEVLEAFREWAEKTEIPDTGDVTVSMWISGAELEREARLLPRRKPPEPGQVKTLLEGLKQDKPARIDEKLRSIKGAVEGTVLSDSSIEMALADVGSVLPEELIKPLNGLRIEVTDPDQIQRRADATYFQGKIKLNQDLQNSSPEALRAALAHESTHWMWPHLEDGAKRKLRAFFEDSGARKANWITERVTDEKELLAYYFEVFFSGTDRFADVANNSMHREALNLVAEALKLNHGTH
jgi:SPP1 gp7 family putative phage head morphogenesis protein